MPSIQLTQITTYEEEIPTALRGFHNWEFSSGGHIGEDFKVFSRLFKKYVNSQIPSEAVLTFHVGHYDVSGFVGLGGKFVYFSVSDVRYFQQEWLKHILIRTATSDKDYTGGTNQYTTLDRFGNDIVKLLQ